MVGYQLNLVLQSKNIGHLYCAIHVLRHVPIRHNTSPYMLGIIFLVFSITYARLESTIHGKLMDFTSTYNITPKDCSISMVLLPRVLKSCSATLHCACLWCVIFYVLWIFRVGSWIVICFIFSCIMRSLLVKPPLGQELRFTELRFTQMCIREIF